VECEKNGNGVDVSALTNEHNSGLKRFLCQYVSMLFKVVVCQLSLCQHLQRSGVERSGGLELGRYAAGVVIPTLGLVL
jgi:hypothetical protein